MQSKSSIRFGLLLAILFAFGQMAFSQTGTSAPSTEIDLTEVFSVKPVEEAFCPCPPNNLLVTLLGEEKLCANTQTLYMATFSCSNEHLFTWTWTALTNCTIVSTSDNTAVIQPTTNSGNATFRVGATLNGCTFTRSKTFTRPITTNCWE